MKRNQVQHFIDGRRVTKIDFLSRHDEEMKKLYVQQQYLIDSKVFSLGQIRNYEKQNLLSPVRYKGGKYFKKDDIRALLKENI